MTTAQLDLSELAIDRESPDFASPRFGNKRQIVTRYLIPGLLIFGFLGITSWASWDLMFPAMKVNVIPVVASRDMAQASGTPLFNAAGWVEPRPTPVRVPALAAGVVENLLVVEDQEVKAGEPVAELIKDDAQLVLDMAMAVRSLRQAELQNAKSAKLAADTRYSKPVHLQAELAGAEAALATINTEIISLPFQLQQAESQLTFAHNDYKRNVSATDSVSPREVEEAIATWQTLDAQVKELRRRQASLENEATAIRTRRDAVKEKLDLLVDETQARDQSVAQVAMADAKLRQSQVAVDEAKLQLDRMTVRAPINGKILLLVGQPGTRIGGMRDEMSDTVDGSTIVTMYQPERLQVKVDVRFEDIPDVLPGQLVEIDNPSLDSPITGSVIFVSSEADIQKNTLEVKVAIDQPPASFKPETLVDVTFLSIDIGKAVIEENNQSWQIYVPQNLVRQEEGSNFVWVADRSANVARRVNVTTGKSVAGDMIEIISGLDISSRLITDPANSLKPGQRIQIIEN